MVILHSGAAYIANASYNYSTYSTFTLCIAFLHHTRYFVNQYSPITLQNVNTVVW